MQRQREIQDLVFVRHLVYLRGEDTLYRELSQVCYFVRAYVLVHLSLMLSLAYAYAYAYLLVKTSLYLFLNVNQVTKEITQLTQQV